MLDEISHARKVLDDYNYNTNDVDLKDEPKNYRAGDGQSWDHEFVDWMSGLWGSDNRESKVREKLTTLETNIKALQNGKITQEEFDRHKNDLKKKKKNLDALEKAAREGKIHD